MSPRARVDRPGARPWTQIRWVDEAVWDRFTGIAKSRRTEVGTLLTAVLRDWLGQKRLVCPHCSRPVALCQQEHQGVAP